MLNFPVLAEFLLQFCRYLFYLGKIRTIQLEYTDAKESLLQAARKAPVSALGFRVQCNKWAVIVRLLLGEIPERTVFMQKGMEKALRPYFELTNVSFRLSNLNVNPPLGCTVRKWIRKLIIEVEYVLQLEFSILI